jgi:hypothetical protein
VWIKDAYALPFFVGKAPSIRLLEERAREGRQLQSLETDFVEQLSALYG